MTFIYNKNSAAVISVLVESSRFSSKTLQKGSCPYTPLDEALRYGNANISYLLPYSLNIECIGQWPLGGEDNKQTQTSLEDQIKMLHSSASPPFRKCCFSQDKFVWLMKIDIKWMIMMIWSNIFCINCERLEQVASRCSKLTNSKTS